MEVHGVPRASAPSARVSGHETRRHSPDPLADDLADGYATTLAFDLTPVAELNLHPRARSALRRADVVTVAELAALSDGELAAVPYMGPLFIEQVHAALSERFLSADMPDYVP